MEFKIFPGTLSRDNRKIPLISNWKELATNDKTQIDKWTQEFGDRIKFWGAPTGKINNILVLDVDIKHGDGFETLKQFGEPKTLSQTTLSGGKHYIFRYPNDGNTYGNKVGFLPSLDIRGEAGFIGIYGDFDDLPIGDTPSWILENIEKKHQLTEGDLQREIKLSDSMAKNKLHECLELVRYAPEGQANDTLNAQAYALGQLVRTGNFTKEFIEQQLLEAAKFRGKAEYEAKATISSGIKGGLQRPIVSPFPNTKPELHFQVEAPISDVPLPPEAPEDWTPKYLSIFDLTDVGKLKKPQLFKHWSTEDIHLTTADGGTGKTTLKLFESICLALGERFLGFQPEQRGKTLFITGEDTDKKLSAMLGQICEQMGLFKVTPQASEKLNTVLNSIVIKVDTDFSLMVKNKSGMLEINESAYQKVLKAVHEIKPKMIVFDPIAAFWGPEAMVNDMTKVVAKFMSRLVNDSNACVDMINHMGKASSNTKDISQFAGRGGTALPSHSRVSRVLRGVDANEYKDLTNEELGKGESALLCNVNKFSDGSPLLNEPFLIMRNGFIFTKKDINKALVEEQDDPNSDAEKVFHFVQSERSQGRYPNKGIVTSHFTRGKVMTKVRVDTAIKDLAYFGFRGMKVREIENPDPTIKDKALIIVTEDGSELN